MLIVQGKKAFIQIKGDLHDLASEIALPFMVGAGTISHGPDVGATGTMAGAVALVLIMLINYLFIMGLKQVRRAIPSQKFQTAFDKIMELLLRVDMVVTGASNLMLAAGQTQQEGLSDHFLRVNQPQRNVHVHVIDLFWHTPKT